MVDVTVNWVAVVSAAISTMVVGFIWYSKPLFAKQWLKLSGLSEADIKNGPGMGYALMFVASLFMSYVLAYFVGYLGSETWLDGAKTGLMIALGFVATAYAGDFIFNKKPKELYGITAGYQVVAITIAGAIIAALS